MFNIVFAKKLFTTFILRICVTPMKYLATFKLRMCGKLKHDYFGNISHFIIILIISFNKKYTC